ncbi:spermine oxidase [Biomphalaria glabrata]
MNRILTRTGRYDVTYCGITNVTVLEAQDYVGGRVKCVAVDGQSVELGAQYVHGRQDNPAYNIVTKLGLEHWAQPDNDSEVFNIPEEFLTPHGERTPVTEKIRSQIKELSDKLDKNYDEDVEIDDKDSDKSEGDQYETVYKTYLRGLTDEKDRKLFQAIYRWFKLYQIVDTASADLSDLSIYALSKYKVLPGPRDTYVEGGMTAILRYIENVVSDKICLNTPVQNINWTEDLYPKVCVTYNTNNQEKTILADYVIVTVSIGYLQAKHRELFTPPLPRPLATAIEHIGFGGVGKIFLQWDQPFVGYTRKDDGVQIYELLWTDDNIRLRSDRSQKKKQNGEPWWFGIHSLETVYKCPNVLELWLGKEEAELSEGLEDSEVMDISYELVQLFFSDFVVPPPTAVNRTTWISNPYIRGTYSFLSTQIKKEDLKHLQMHLPPNEEPRVLFAGEGFAREFISTFHGAHLSGLEQADTILTREKKVPDQSLIDFISTQTVGDGLHNCLSSS